MKLVSLLVVALVFTGSAWASDLDDVTQCLAHWGQHPFSKTEPKFRTISSKVKVMGVGGEITDGAKTEKPELVLIKPAVNVMSKSVMTLANPNGWYCLKGKVDVMGKTEINIDCKAHLATSTDAVTVAGSDDSDTGVTVMGKSVVNKVGCKKP